MKTYFKTKSLVRMFFFVIQDALTNIKLNSLCKKNVSKIFNNELLKQSQTCW